ncbi:hypothetical protein LTR37_016269 [Vermiconidia calcicola]|uniref:Uncharacterized protein n=1 Tax=Vermiconidia calcicola TaxID=1690605 RepID=A0ACC3MPE6_9PEZI|nr:hypothetical protein LTR37_016269 [Vermiconidia calcicola]
MHAPHAYELLTMLQRRATKDRNAEGDKRGNVSLSIMRGERLGYLARHCLYHATEEGPTSSYEVEEGIREKLDELFKGLHTEPTSFSGRDLFTIINCSRVFFTIIKRKESTRQALKAATQKRLEDTIFPQGFRGLLCEVEGGQYTRKPRTAALENIIRDAADTARLDTLEVIVN